MISGKGIYIWQLFDDLIPDPETLAEQLVETGFAHVVIKVSNAAYVYNHSGGDLVPSYLAAFRAVGIAVWGFQYVYGNDPIGEARQGIQRTLNLGLDGLVIDAEGEYKHKGAAAARYMSDLRAGLPGVPLALSSYRWPSVHPEFPWREFLAKVDLVMPQVYWVDANNPAEQLRKSIAEYASLAPAKPYIPTGAAYHERGFTATDGQMTEFFQAVKAERLLGCNFWELSNSLRYNLFNTLARLSWSGQTENPEPPEPEPEPEPTSRITLANPYSDRMNFRSDPAVSTETLQGQLYDGTTAEILERKTVGQDEWLRVSVEGWIAKRVSGREYVQE